MIRGCSGNNAATAGNSYRLVTARKASPRKGRTCSGIVFAEEISTAESFVMKLT